MADELPKPASRKELYLAKAAGMDVDELPKPASRIEEYLNAIAEGGGGGGGYTLPIASASKLGGVKVGTGLAIDADTGVLSTSGGSGPTVVQTTGTSTTDVMSQDAATQMVFTSADQTGVRIGKYSGNYGSNSVAIGASASSSAYNNATAIGFNARTNNIGAVAIGANSGATAQGEFNIGSTNSSTGYKNTFTRLLTGVHAPENDTDAANKAYVDSKGVKTLTTSDYNYPANSPTGICGWTLADGEYRFNTPIMIYSGADGDYTSWQITGDQGKIEVYSSAPAGEPTRKIIKFTIVETGEIYTGYTWSNADSGLSCVQRFWPDAEA